jgi:hypothetical protein
MSDSLGLAIADAGFSAVGLIAVVVGVYTDKYNNRE